MIVTIDRHHMSDEEYKRKIEAANMLNAILDLISKSKWSDIASDDLVFDMCVACWELGMTPTEVYINTAPACNSWSDYENFKDRTTEIAGTINNKDDYLSLSENRDILVTKGMQLDDKDRKITLYETNKTDMNQCERRKWMDKYSVDLTKKGCNRNDATRAATVINGIYSYVKTNGWHQGMRNNISVDLCIACNILDIDPKDFFTKMIYPLKEIQLVDTYDFKERYETIQPYCNSVGWKSYPFYFMLEESLWKSRSQGHQEVIELIFE